MIIAKMFFVIIAELHLTGRARRAIPAQRRATVLLQDYRTRETGKGKASKGEGAFRRLSSFLDKRILDSPLDRVSRKEYNVYTHTGRL